jgi:rSAM/selenodomain-associated transferase 2
LKISIIIPTYNKAQNIGKLIEIIKKNLNNSEIEIIISDSPNSTDETYNIAKKLDLIALKSPQKGRAAQMNFGAKNASGDVLYFVHADTQLHPDFVNDINESIKSGFELGCYRYIFDSKKLLLKINSFFTRFDKIWCRGGDQTLFITRKAFDELGEFRDDYLIMEDYEFIIRAKKRFKFRIIPKNVIVSARKYEKNSYFRVQFANLKVMRMFLSGNYSQTEMQETYKRMLCL